VPAAQADVVEPAVVPQRHHAGGVDLVAADAEVAGDDHTQAAGDGLGSGVEDRLRSTAGDDSVRPDGVVVAAEVLQLRLQVENGRRRRLAGEPLLGHVPSSGV